MAMKCLSFNLLVLLLSILPYSVSSQDNSAEPERGSIMPGFIINLQGDTIKGYLLNINLWLNQKMTFFYTDPEDHEGRIRYTPKEIKAYQVGRRYYESIKHPFTNSVRSENFLMRKVNGPIKYYIWYYDEDKTRLMTLDNISIADLGKAFLFDESELWKDEFAIRQGEQTLTAFNLKFLLKFSRNMAEYVGDNAELAKKIADKKEGYKNINIESIIREYNDWYLKNHTN